MAGDITTWALSPLTYRPGGPPTRLLVSANISMGILRLYLIVAGGLVLVRIVMLAIGKG